MSADNIFTPDGKSYDLELLKEYKKENCIRWEKPSDDINYRNNNDDDPFQILENALINNPITFLDSNAQLFDGDLDDDSNKVFLNSLVMLLVLYGELSYYNIISKHINIIEKEGEKRVLPKIMVRYYVYYRKSSRLIEKYLKNIFDGDKHCGKLVEYIVKIIEMYETNDKNKKYIKSIKTLEIDYDDPTIILKEYKQKFKDILKNLRIEGISLPEGTLREHYINFNRAKIGLYQIYG